MRLARAVHWLDVTWWNRPALVGETSMAGRRPAWLKAVGLSSAVVAIVAGYMVVGRPYTTLGPSTPGPQSSASWSTGQYYTIGNPVVDDGLVFDYAYAGRGHVVAVGTSSNLGENAMLYAFDASTGRVEWKFAFIAPVDALVPLGSPGPVMAVDGGAIYVVSANWLYALSADRGSILWKQAIQGYLWSALATEGLTVYFTYNNIIYALDALNGKTRWATKIPSVAASGSAVGVAVIGDATLNLTSFSAISPKVIMYGFDEASGRITWSRNISSLDPPRSFAGPNIPSAGGRNDTVYFTTGFGTLSAIDGLNGKIAWNSAVPDASITPVVEGGTVYVGTATGMLYAVNTQTGDPRWSFTAGKDSDGHPGAIESIGASGDIVYVESDSTEYALGAADGIIKWGYYFGGDYFSSFYPPEPTPVLQGGVYLGLGYSVLALRGGLVDRN
jgi:eukaryotic-like serine/threonine-protein kinase